MLKRISIDFWIIFSIFLLDRLSKYLIIQFSDPLYGLNIKINSFLNFNLVWNKGIAFGLLSFDQNFSYNILTFVIFLITVIIFYVSPKN
jgi:Lipoprotein signal peptidase